MKPSKQVGASVQSWSNVTAKRSTNYDQSEPAPNRPRMQRGIVPVESILISANGPQLPFTGRSIDAPQRQKKLTLEGNFPSRQFSQRNDVTTGFNEFAIMQEGVPETASDKSVEFMLKYGREYLAFTLGYNVAKHYEIQINDLDANAFSLQSKFESVPKNDLLDTLVHAMKIKMISPQGLLITLKAIFLRP